jgi:hypothetical protein
MKEWLLEYWEFIRTHKSYWLVPLLCVLLLTGGLIIFAQGSAISPFIYSFF